MDGSGSGVNINTVELVNAADGFAKASKDTQHHADALDAALKPYATNPDKFQGPPADEFRRIYREIWDDLATVKKEALAMSVLVDTAKQEFSKIANNAAGQIPRGGGDASGTILQTLRPS